MSCTERNTVSQRFLHQHKELLWRVVQAMWWAHYLNAKWWMEKSQWRKGRMRMHWRNTHEASVHPMRVVQNGRSYRSASFTYVNTCSSLWRIAQTAWWVPFLNAKWRMERSQWHFTLKSQIKCVPNVRVVQNATLRFLHQRKELTLLSGPLPRLLREYKCLFLHLSTIGCINTFKTKLSHLLTGYG